MRGNHAICVRVGNPVLTVSDSDIYLAGLQTDQTQTEHHANVRFRLRRSITNSVFIQLQFEAFYTVNLLNAKWNVVPAQIQILILIVIVD